MVKTFTQSEEVISYLQGQYGSANFSQWQILRGSFYSYVTYPEAGQSELTFFGNALGASGVTLHDTNLPKQGSFGQVHFLVKAIHTRVHIQNQALASFAIASSNTTTLASDMIAGFTQAGVLTFDVQSRNFLTLPQPFQYAACGHGRKQVNSSGIVLASGLGAPPGVDLASREKNAFILDPNILIEAEQNFSCKIAFPTGLVPVIGTGVTDDTTNPLKVGVYLDGIIFRPLQ